MKIWRIAQVYKSGPSDTMNNYKPITALPLFSKVFEKPTLVRMQSFVMIQYSFNLSIWLSEWA